MKKKTLIASLLAITFTSCSTTMEQTATQRQITCPIISASVADLEVSEKKVTCTFTPTKELQSAGEEHCINAAIQEALKPSGGDVLVETHQAIITKRGFFSKKVTSVTVSGYPAKYKNFHPVNSQEVFSAFKAGVLNETGDSKGAKNLFGVFKK